MENLKISRPAHDMVWYGHENMHVVFQKFHSSCIKNHWSGRLDKWNVHIL